MSSVHLAQKEVKQEGQCALTNFNCPSSSLYTSSTFLFHFSLAPSSHPSSLPASIPSIPYLQLVFVVGMSIRELSELLRQFQAFTNLLQWTRDKKSQQLITKLISNIYNITTSSTCLHTSGATKSSAILMQLQRLRTCEKKKKNLEDHN